MSPSPPRAEARVLRRTRLRLALWSGGTTLVVLLILGVIVYALVAQQLARDSEAQLRARATLVAALTDPASDSAADEVALVAAAEKTGVLFGGPLSGTIAVTAEKAKDVSTGLAGKDAAKATAMTDEAFAAKQASMALKDRIADAVVATGSSSDASKLTLKDIDGVPTRIVSVDAGTPEEPFVVHAIADRTIELRTMSNLAMALFVGGALAVVAASLAGWVYSGRALVPIRASLRRQRDFAADASHELRTPLTVVRNNLEILARHPTADPMDQQALEDATVETERMGRLVDDLLLLARTDADAAPIDSEELDLAEAALSAVDGLTDAAERRRVSIELDLDPTPTRGDAGRLRQLATILVDNAIRHGREGGHVWVSVGTRAGHAELVVADDGPGIPAAHRDDAFERFWRAPTVETSGSGLGLAIAAWIVAAHDGSIALVERPGGGTRFKVELPD
jgi:signal transduction histidine kinase